MKYFFFFVILFSSITFNTQSQTKTTTEDPIFTLVDEMPSFPGGESEMGKFLRENLKYPPHEKDAHISGKCFLTFVIEKDGHLADIKILKGVTGGPGCNQEAIRVVTLMPNWNPGKNKNEPVRVQYNLPIKFTLLSKDSEILQDTIYLNPYSQECSSEKAKFYRIVSKRDDGYLVKDFYMKTKTLQMIAVCNELKPIKKNGHCKYFLESEQKSSEGNYIQDKMVGSWTFWEEGDTDSTTIECFADGMYKNIHLSKSRITSYDKYNTFYKMEEPATFPGGEDKMNRWLVEHIDRRGYPDKEKRAGISGTCYVTFVVDKDGSISDIDLLRGVPNGPGYDKLVMDLVKEMPLWKPGIQYGRAVRVQFNLPVRFVMK
jgi:TonB family protein